MSPMMSASFKRRAVNFEKRLIGFIRVYRPSHGKIEVAQIEGSRDPPFIFYYHFRAKLLKTVDRGRAQQLRRLTRGHGGAVSHYFQRISTERAPRL